MKKIHTNPVTDENGGVAMMFAILAPVLLAITGLAIDSARLIMARQILQDASDSAALAGASAFDTTSSGVRAQTTANNYYGKAGSNFPTWIGSPQGAATPSMKGDGLYVTFIANGIVYPIFMARVMGRITVNVTSVAVNPIMAVDLAIVNLHSDAQDWNSVYVYPIPRAADGTWDYTYRPSRSEMVEVGSNCRQYQVDYDNASNKSGDTKDVNVTRCWGQPDAVPLDAPLKISSTQPFGWALRNVTAGNDGLYETDPSPDKPPLGQYGNNYIWPWGYVSQYGSPSADLQANPQTGNWHFSGFDSAFQSPEAMTDAINLQTEGLQTFFDRAGGSSAFGTFPRSSDASSSFVYHEGQNCSLQVSIVSADNIPSKPPVTGKCFTPGPGDSVFQYTNKSCSQLGKATYEFWWNDMGDLGVMPPSTIYIGDDYNYTDLMYLASCSGNGKSMVHLLK